MDPWIPSSGRTAKEKTRKCLLSSSVATQSMQQTCTFYATIQENVFPQRDYLFQPIYKRICSHSLTTVLRFGIILVFTAITSQSTRIHKSFSSGVWQDSDPTPNTFNKLQGGRVWMSDAGAYN